MSKRASFTRFGELPAEIRRMIWDYSLPMRNKMYTDYDDSWWARWRHSKVIKSEDWSRNQPAHLLTCPEAREVALRRRPWAYYTQINMLYLQCGLENRFYYDSKWIGHVGRTHTLVLGSEWLYQKSKSVSVEKLFKFSRREFYSLTAYFQSFDIVFEVWGERDPQAASLDKILLVMATVRRHGPKWLFADSGLVVLGFNDPRLKQALEDVAPWYTRGKTGSSQRAQGAVYGVKEIEQQLLPEWLSLKYQKLQGIISRLLSALERLTTVNPFVSQFLKDGKLELAIAFEKKGGLPYWKNTLV
ncbi:hypothetical protein RRF57_009358 [Xylaria bambusicola]|uniref:2EXR domain-containing protein n=1 Tax=Xylaria bambusicola TaxID=326684 RepID=A0AAN7UZB5_9PEZI